MVFSSPAFLFLFLPCFFTLYFLTPRVFRNGFILLGSLFFYLLGAGPLMLVALGLVVFNWFVGRSLGNMLAHSSLVDDRQRRITGLMTVGVATNLMPLLFFKYSVFLVHLAHDLFGMHALQDFNATGWSLPLGISFYTFHFLSYLFDVRARRIHPEASLTKFAIYIFLFPHLVAGPVVRFAEIKAQLDTRCRRLVHSDIFWGLTLFIIGLSKKILIGDPLGGVVDSVYQHDSLLTTYSAWLATMCYSFQIYFDFSGYTDMAIGMARVMGFHFPRNFNRPYAAKSITEFWRRWHMTLSRWFRDYLYIPLGGNRGSLFATYRNLIIVFGMCGLWHGAAYTFLAWGLGHGALLALERSKLLRLNSLPVPNFLVFIIVTLLWVPFRAQDMSQAAKFVQAMFGLGSGTHLWLDANRVLADAKIIFLLGLSLCICLAPDARFQRLRRLSFRHPVAVGVYCLILYVLAGISVVEHGFNPFIYFQF